jgi:hypothetical protein
MLTLRIGGARHPTLADKSIIMIHDYHEGKFASRGRVISDTIRNTRATTKQDCNAVLVRHSQRMAVAGINYAKLAATKAGRLTGI